MAHKAPTTHMTRLLFMAALFLVMPFMSRASSMNPVHIISPKYTSTDLYRHALRSVNRHSNRLVSPSAIIVNHHLLAADLITKTFRQVRPMSVRRIILISPNHFATGPGMVTTTDRAFTTPFGRIGSDMTMITALRRSSAFTVNDSAFAGEHGIFGLLPIIRHEFPRAQLVPIVIKDGITSHQLNDAYQALVPWLGPGTLVIGSFDFSHDQPLEVADAEDARSLEVLRDVAPERINRVAVDSRPGLALVMRVARAQAASRFTLVAHGNSARYVGALDAPATTSYITGYFSR